MSVYRKEFTAMGGYLTDAGEVILMSLARLNLSNITCNSDYLYVHI